MQVLERLSGQQQAAHARAEAEAQRLSGETQALEGRLKQAEAEQKLLQQQLKQHGARARQERGQLARQVAAQEEQVRALKRKVEAAIGLEKEGEALKGRRGELLRRLEELGEQLEKLGAVQEALVDVLEGSGCEEAVRQLQAQAESAGSRVEHLQGLLQAEEQACEEGRRQLRLAQEGHEACQAGCARAEARWQAAQVRAGRCEAELRGVGSLGVRECGGEEAGGGCGGLLGPLGSLAAVRQAMEGAEQKLSRLSLRRRVLERSSPGCAPAGLLRQQQQGFDSGGSASHPLPARQLHQCFCFAQPPHSEEAERAAGAATGDRKPSIERFLKALATGEQLLKG